MGEKEGIFVSDPPISARIGHGSIWRSATFYLVAGT